MAMALECWISHKLYYHLSSRVLAVESGEVLRRKLFELCSEYVQPRLARSDTNSLVLSKTWASYDDGYWKAARDKGAAMNAKTFIAQDLVDAAGGLDSIARRQRYSESLSRLVGTVMRMPCAANGLSGSEFAGFPKPIGDALTTLLEVGCVGFLTAFTYS